jgi:hypothetical protein
MNKELQEQLQQELIKSRAPIGFIVGLGVWVGMLVLVANLVPGGEEFMNAHHWASVVLLVLSVAIGWFVGGVRETRIRHDVLALDDDMLKHRHDEMSRSKLRSDVIFYLGVALVIAYFVFK